MQPVSAASVHNNPVVREFGTDVGRPTKGQKVETWSSSTAPQRPGCLGREAEDRWWKVKENYHWLWSKWGTAWLDLARVQTTSSPIYPDNRSTGEGQKQTRMSKKRNSSQRKLLANLENVIISD